MAVLFAKKQKDEITQAGAKEQEKEGLFAAFNSPSKKRMLAAVLEAR